MAGEGRSVSPFDRVRAWTVWKLAEWNRTLRRAWSLLATLGSGRWFSSPTRPRPGNGKTRSVARSRCWPIRDSLANDREGGGGLRRRSGRRGILWFQDRSLTVAVRKSSTYLITSPSFRRQQTELIGCSRSTFLAVKTQWIGNEEAIPPSHGADELKAARIGVSRKPRP